MGMGASADGRLAGQPTADDFAAAPWPDDLPFNSQESGRMLPVALFGGAVTLHWQGQQRLLHQP
ncbi:hypothetical protein GCM10007160_28200 [Litchfieldella qijiaojingensis]|uniref:Uncharacterized protein n=1 Tax=Litchfieldella qijiaojingensis TaxID=980347 RepID=A0ABQ2YXT9_9GAMM|nr:hypothetical protein [Halomonas qijiaojingensis]GGX98817.1 hypothetical protein GCM10007160_28200 [Halomonas qijiaojingensis]